jgi:hypothetical protein
MTRRRRNSITAAWAARTIEMLESPAYRVLSQSAHRALSRIEIELAHHGGEDNGKLPVTFDDFVDYGMHRTAIGPALAELEALGFIRITEHGKMARSAEYRRPNKFLLMSRPPQKGTEALPQKWRQFATIAEAEAAQAAVRPKRKSRQYGKRTGSQYGKRTDGGQIASTESVPLRMSQSVPLSISRVGYASDDPTNILSTEVAQRSRKSVARRHRADETASAGKNGAPRSDDRALAPLAAKNARLCQACGAGMEGKARQARFCSLACRQRRAAE